MLLDHTVQIERLLQDLRTLRAQVREVDHRLVSLIDQAGLARDELAHESCTVSRGPCALLTSAPGTPPLAEPAED